MSQISTRLVAARLICYINSEKFAKVTEFSWTVETTHREIEGIDSDLPYELAPTRTRVKGQLGLIRLENDGGIQGVGMAPPENLLSRQKYFTIALVDRKTDTVVFRSDYCSVDMEQWSVNARGELRGSVSFKGLTWSNEVEAH